jgi:signal transduction histidine kinase
MAGRAGTACASIRAIGYVRFASAILLATIFISLQSDPVFATPMTLDVIIRTLWTLDRHEIAQLALTLGILVFAVTTAIALVRTRSKNVMRLAAARSEIARLREEADRATTLLLAEPQVVVVWRDAGRDPLILGDPSNFTGVEAARRVLAFGIWLGVEEAHTLDQAVERLRQRGEAFTLQLITPRGRHIQAEGRPIGAAAVLRLRDISGVRLEQAALAERLRHFEREIGHVKALLEVVPTPIWLHDSNGRLSFANQAYARAVEAADAKDAIARGLELLDQSVRDEAAQARAANRVFTKRLPAVIAGSRRVLDVIEVGGARGSAGIGLDLTEAESVRAELGRIVSAHRRTLDELTTAVAIFGADERLVFHNTAYRSLFQLDAAFLDERPRDSAVLDRLRADRRLPEQADYRSWKAQLFEAYRALEPKEHWWHMPGGRVLRVVTNPNPEGGVTYLFDDITERIELESRYNALIQTQGETLDALAEAVAVFGSDGRLKLYNPAFVSLWKLPPAATSERPHIDKVAQWCRPFLDESNLHNEYRGNAVREPWSAIQLAVTGLERQALSGLRLEYLDGRMLDCAATPLPDGGTLVTFRDISDSARFERALTERNEALVAADVLKNNFVHHVSYELRSPLTTIIGYAQMLDDPSIGPLTKKQREYIDHVAESSRALLAIIDDILDLATIDAGAMALELSEVDIRSTMIAAAKGVQDRVSERSIKLDIRAPEDIGCFVADERRVRQILFNLMSNAIDFSPPGETVLLTAERQRDTIVIRISDKGPGIPSEIKKRVFDLFESHNLGSTHRGAGLGLSIVRSLIVLHGGSVSIDSEPGRGTVVTCIFPVSARTNREAAE